MTSHIPRGEDAGEGKWEKFKEKGENREGKNKRKNYLVSFFAWCDSKVFSIILLFPRLPPFFGLRYLERVPEDVRIRLRL